MKKLLLSILFFALLAADFHFALFAQEDFSTDSSVIYEVNKEGVMTVTNNITIKNLSDRIYAKDYTLFVEGMKPENIKSYQGKKELMVESTRIGDQSFSIKVNFSDLVVGKDNKREFSIIFLEKSLVSKTGEVWEVTVPRLTKSDNYKNYSVTLIIPTFFGEESYLSPRPTDMVVTEEKRYYYFNDLQDLSKGVSVAFGNFQIFSFDLTYHLENPINKGSFIEIAIPPDTSFQRVFYEKIEPLPTNVVRDDEGNWLALFNLKPRERFDVKVLGYVKIFSEKQLKLDASPELLAEYLKETDFWQVNDPKIKSLSNKLKNPKEIYEYIRTTLSYDYDRVSEGVQRKGALSALENPKNSICMEFTDLFIALSRAAGIPAREVNGFAYTENPKIQPLSLVADVLHSWPEYWDYGSEVWVPVDPTWGSTTGGVDYFSKLDLRHFTFVVHGRDPAKPYPPGSYKLGSNPQKDVFVSLATSFEPKISKPILNAEKQTGFPFGNTKIKITLTNSGPSAVYKKSIFVNHDSVQSNSFENSVLLPFGKKEFYHTVASHPFDKTKIKTISVVMDNQNIQININDGYRILATILFVFSLLVLIIVILFLILYREKVKKIIKIFLK